MACCGHFLPHRCTTSTDLPTDLHQHGCQLERLRPFSVPSARRLTTGMRVGARLSEPSENLWHCSLHSMIWLNRKARPWVQPKRCCRLMRSIWKACQQPRTPDQNQHQAVPDYPHHPTGKGWQERRPAPMCYIRLGVATAYASQSRRADNQLARPERRRRKLKYWRKPASSLVLSLSAWTAPSICTVNRHAGSHFPVPAIRVKVPAHLCP